MATTASLPALLQRRRRELLLAAGVAILGYAGYRAYRSDTVAAWRRAAGRLGALLDSASDTLASGSDLTGCLVKDVRDFLGSEDAAALPPRLKQLAALLQTEEVGAATSHTVAAIWAGLQDGASPWGWGGRGRDACLGQSVPRAPRMRSCRAPCTLPKPPPALTCSPRRLRL